MHLTTHKTQVLLQVGCAAGFLIPPLLVPYSENLDEIGRDLGIMFYIGAGVTTALFLTIIVGK
jgi:FLVCR family feline leukemia virus subgroup C receptor-related protein